MAEFAKTNQALTPGAKQDTSSLDLTGVRMGTAGIRPTADLSIDQVADRIAALRVTPEIAAAVRGISSLAEAQRTTADLRGSVSELASAWGAKLRT